MKCNITFMTISLEIFALLYSIVNSYLSSAFYKYSEDEKEMQSFCVVVFIQTFFRVLFSSLRVREPQPAYIQHQSSALSTLSLTLDYPLRNIFCPFCIHFFS